MSIEDFFKEYPSYQVFNKKMKELRRLYKKRPNDVIWWVDNPGRVGIWEFSFDKKEIFNLFRDYPWELTDEQKRIFDKENPEWATFFRNRTRKK